MVADISYSGSRSTFQAYTTNINQPVPNANVLGGKVAIDAVRPYYGLGSISDTQWGQNGRYNSLQAQLKRPVSKGLFLLASYTREKVTVDGGGTDPRNRAYDAGEMAMHDFFQHCQHLHAFGFRQRTALAQGGAPRMGDLQAAPVSCRAARWPLGCIPTPPA